MESKKSGRRDTPRNPPAKRLSPKKDSPSRDAASALPAVLLVDDVPANLVALEAILKDDGVEILTARSGPAALEILLEREVAIAIVDVQMPGMDGFELAELMRGVERTGYVPIIFLTAAPRDLSRVFKGYEFGAVDFLYKPIDNGILRSKVEVFVTLERQRQEIRQAEAMREMFIGILGHDLGNPLSSIMMTAEVLQARSRDQDTRESAGRILRNGDRMLRMIRQLLDAARFRLGSGITLSPAPADLRRLVEQVLAEFEHVRERFQFDVGGDSAGTWDADLMLQVVSNLVGNAVRHSASGSPIRIEVDGDGESVCLRLHNVGKPIPEELRGVLFEAFRAGDSSSREKGGLGLGLYITRQLVLAHGGTLSFESSEEAGTTFVASIPRHVSTAVSTC